MMQCPNCQIDVVAGVVFCNHCGVRIQKLCNNCYSSNSAESRFCRSCGGSLSSQPEPPTPQPSVSSTVTPRGQSMGQEGITTCPRCSKVNEPGSAYCFSCGLPLEGDSTSHVKEGPSSVPLSLPSLPRESAGFWIRFIAYLIDAVVLGIATSFLHLITGEPTEVSFGWMTDGVTLILELHYCPVN